MCRSPHDSVARRARHAHKFADYGSLCVGAIHTFILVHLGLCTYMFAQSTVEKCTVDGCRHAQSHTHTPSLLLGSFQLRFRPCTDGF